MGKEWLLKKIWQPVWLVEFWLDNPSQVQNRYCHRIPVGNALEYNGNIYTLRSFEVLGAANQTPTILLKSPSEVVNGRTGVKILKVEESALTQGRTSDVPFDGEALISLADYRVVAETVRIVGDVELRLSPYYKAPKIKKVYRRCPWEYRGPRENGEGCGYDGSEYFDRNNRSISSRQNDFCNKSIQACNLRFQNSNNQPFGGAEITFDG